MHLISGLGRGEGRRGEEVVMVGAEGDGTGDEGGMHVTFGVTKLVHCSNFHAMQGA